MRTDMLLLALCCLYYNGASAYNIGISQFSWEQCGGEGQVNFQSLRVPSSLSDTVRYEDIYLNASIDGNLTAPMRMQLSISKWFIFFWIPLPCVAGYGSCTYEDICTTWDICPLPGSNGYQMFDYTIPRSAKDAIYSYALDGRYKGKMHVTKNGETVACIEVHVKKN